MDYISFFKLQSKNLHKDFKTKKKVYDEIIEDYLYDFTPQFFNIDEIVASYDFSDEEIENFSLMKAQHFISQLVGFNKWNELIKASLHELELAKLLFDNQHKLSKEDWDMYISDAENINHTIFSHRDRLNIFQMVFLQDGNFATMPNDFRLNP